MKVFNEKLTLFVRANTDVTTKLLNGLYFFYKTRVFLTNTFFSSRNLIIVLQIENC